MGGLIQLLHKYDGSVLVEHVYVLNFGALIFSSDYRYSKAMEAKKERSIKSSHNFGAKGTRGGHPNQVME